MRLFVSLGCTLLLVTTALAASEDSDQQLQNRLRAHIEFLADDLMLGRQPGTSSYNIAANYVASQFRQMGLTPAGNNGTYFQQVPLRRAFLEPGSAEIEFSRGDETTPLVFVEDFYMTPSLARTSITRTGRTGRAHHSPCRTGAGRMVRGGPGTPP